MDRLTTLDFEALHDYADLSAGILVPIRLIFGDRSVELRARLDTGAADCLFDRYYADVLELPEQGLERDYRTITGSFKASGHEITVETLGFQWQATVFFCAMGNPANAFLGRRGWLDRVRLGIVHYEQRLYVGQYGA
jgi:hypothetical protein